MACHPMFKVCDPVDLNIEKLHPLFEPWTLWFKARHLALQYPLTLVMMKVVSCLFRMACLSIINEQLIHFRQEYKPTDFQIDMKDL